MNTEPRERMTITKTISIQVAIDKKHMGHKLVKVLKYLLNILSWTCFPRNQAVQPVFTTTKINGPNLSFDLEPGKQVTLIGQNLWR